MFSALCSCTLLIVGLAFVYSVWLNSMRNNRENGPLDFWGEPKRRT